MWKKIRLGIAIGGGAILGIASIPILLGFGVEGIAAGSVASVIKAIAFGI